MTLAGTIVPLPLASCLKDGDWGVECSSIFQEVVMLLGGVQREKNTPIPSPKEIRSLSYSGARKFLCETRKQKRTSLCWDPPLGQARGSVSPFSSQMGPEATNPRWHSRDRQSRDLNLGCLTIPLDQLPPPDFYQASNHCLQE